MREGSREWREVERNKRFCNAALGSRRLFRRDMLRGCRAATFQVSHISRGPGRLVCTQSAHIHVVVAPQPSSQTRSALIWLYLPDNNFAYCFYVCTGSKGRRGRSAERVVPAAMQPRRQRDGGQPLLGWYDNGHQSRGNRGALIGRVGRQ